MLTLWNCGDRHQDRVLVRCLAKGHHHPCGHNCGSPSFQRAQKLIHFFNKMADEGVGLLIE